ncbi:MAG: hypothetical protein K9J37_06015 [Saprospiraceae bacterium]|nr:hypothetical protein [Saprospiraceae bacterium]MCF8249447.1 hypothetical protein [Saprospiraceae bacterium]
MKILLKIKLLLLITCIIADTVMPLFVNQQDVQAIEICLEAEHENEKGFGEEKAEADKVVSKIGLSFDAETQQFFDHDKLAKHFYSLPIPTQPPKSVG